MKLELITEEEAMEEPKVQKIQIWPQLMCGGSIEIRARKGTAGPGYELIIFYPCDLVEIYPDNLKRLGIEIRNVFTERCDCEEV